MAIKPNRIKMAEQLRILNEIKINGYKSIKLLDLELKPLNILIGANGAGKSNFISFFKFIKRIVDKELQLYTAEQGGSNKILHFGSKKTSELSFLLHFTTNGYNAKLISTVNDKLIFKNESVNWFKDNGAIKEKALDNNGGDNSKLPDRGNSKSISGHVVSYIQDWKPFHFHDTSSSSKIKQTCNINDCTCLAVDGGNIAPFLRSIRESNQKSYQQIIKTIRRVAPFFKDFILDPEMNNVETIRLKWKHQGSDDYFDANDFSDGTLRFICLATLLLQPNLPTIIILDEPEIGLHPFALRILSGMLKQISHKTQVIASTQSATFADCFDIEDVIVVNRKENNSEFERLEQNKYNDWLEEYSLGEIWQKNLIGGVPSYD